MPTEHGMIFVDSLALGVHRGTKIDTRRPMSTANTRNLVDFRKALASEHKILAPHLFCRIRAGDRVWVRECFAVIWGDADRCRCETSTPGYCSTHDTIEYRADTGAAAPGGWDEVPADQRLVTWTPSIHMPRWAARTVLPVASVHAERLAPLSEDEALAEGFDSPDEFAATWDAIYSAKGIGMAASPWVWTIRFASNPAKSAS